MLVTRTLRNMKLQHIKLALAAAWLLVVALIGIVGVTFPGGLVGLVALAVAPPIGMWLLWTEPTETLSESIHSGRR